MVDDHGADRPLSHEVGEASDLVARLSSRIVGQPAALEYIVPFIQMHQAGLAPAGRPAGIFLLLGPTGTGKTRTVEALAGVLHGNEKHLLRVDCGEFQSDHEVAKIIGAPPGYLGHRETRPMLTQERLKAVTSPHCDISLVLFDEIEKAAPALTVLLLGILDKASLRLGDNTEVDFEHTLIFLTSNLGAREMMREVSPDIGFQPIERPSPDRLAGRMENIGLAAVRRRFSPEFVNRLDVVITYQPLDANALAAILDQHIAEFQGHVKSRLGERSFDIEVTQPARTFLLEHGTSAVYGARELKRVVHRHLTQPVAALVANGRIESGARVTVDRIEGASALAIAWSGGTEAPAVREPRPLVLVVDDNRDLLDWLASALGGASYDVAITDSVEGARRIAASQTPDAALLDVMLPDGDGIRLALELREARPDLQVVVMTGTVLAPEETAICTRHDFPILRKPFLGADAIELLTSRLARASARARGSGRG
jgi:CheY-like chemotaxis protein/MoxR-like ATPase